MASQRNTGAGAEAELPEYAGHYRLESRLGSGGMGVVHLARSTSGLKLAVKVVHAEFARDPEFRGRFRQEVAAARRVSGAFTAPVVDADPEAERPWMATLFIPGPTLAEQVKRNGPMASFQLRQLMAGLAEALRDIHRVGVVHRDLKPSNVLLADDGPKVIDFGISRPSDSELRTETGKLIGTPPFMAPEQFRRPREVGPAADIFALGSVLVHAATGRGPFDSDSPYVVAYQVVHDEPDLTGVPDDLVPLVLSCLAKEPEDRPAPDELMRELRSAAASYDTQAFIPLQRTRADEPASAAGLGQTGPARDHAPEAEGDDELSAGDGKISGRSQAKRRPTLRLRRRMVLGAGALGLAVIGALVTVPLLTGGDTVPKSTVSHAEPPWFDAWEVGLSGKQGFAQCSYGTGRLLCAQSGRVFALDPDDGDELWRHTVPKGPSLPPVASGGLVQPTLAQGRGLEALDPASGKPKWRQDAAAYQHIARAGNMLLLTGADGTVTAVDGASGDTKWSHPIPGHPTPAFQSFAGDPLAYAASTSVDTGRTHVTAVDPRSGEVRWEARLAGSLRPVGTADRAVVFLSVGTVYGEARSVVRYEPDTRKVRRATLAVPLEQPHGTVRGNTAYLTGAGGRLVAVDTAALRQRWSVETGMTRTSVPAADERHVYVTAPDGRLIAVDVRDGRLVGQTSVRLGAAGDRVAGALPRPVVVGGRVFGSAPDGSVFGVDGRDPAGW
ncbi:serine/threonine-protein kinase [Streptomyces sp. 15-116A]|uniref:serine/threonine-protein kinase n=1 Tax=Streptomyces sp. 15-116A TaxID=2259035 RepID=UPI0021B2A93C|nr:serine/threonine-protein kinase [Streptomyces sp. 15-116A]MCT7355717.1 serine/threonine-protein kinase [Streptomyces sp. 15-116A]